ncbi:acetylxylan esterase [Thalassoglobus sp. JC818]|uniref:alpha/beta hydrolase n=1 Tax=Thalassoglobus sp. JC818 TaxID=3232136 RepID=UPI00345A1C34
MKFSRRRFAQSLFLPTTSWWFSSGILTGLAGRAAFAEDEKRPALNRYPRMVHNFFVDQVRQVTHRNRRLKEAIKSPEDAQRYVESVRAKIRESFGPEPERTPLNAQVTGVLERDGYRVEKIIFESRPNFPVTANLYLPTNVTGKIPGVVGTCGHSSNGKASEAYQSFSQGLARLGMACLIYDPIGQGERSQYVDENLKSSVRLGVGQHLHAGNQQFLVGEFLGSWRAWDGIRALDYLLSREEIDAERVGVTGNSGGGTMTTWLCGVESRWTMAAPSCFVTSFLNNLENELPADTEQCPPKALALRLDHEDFLVAMAPKPVTILAKERDYFDVRGAEAAAERLTKIYSQLGAGENIRLFVGPTEHGFSEENRLAMYQSFSKACGLGDVEQEPELIIEKDEDLWCTPRGQASLLDGAKTIADFTREHSEQLKASRPKLTQKELIERVRAVLRLPLPENEVPDYQIYRNLGSRGYPLPQATAYSVNTEPGVSAIVYRLSDSRWYSRPPKSTNAAVLYVSHLSSDAELRDELLVRELIEKSPNDSFYTCDVRGIGESMPDTCGANSFHSDYGSDYFYAIHSLMLDRPYLGQKTLDVLRVVDWLHSFGHEDVHLVGNGWGSLPVLFAAVLNPSIKKVTLKNPIESYSSVAEEEHYDLPLAQILPNVLQHFDLPDCLAALDDRELVIVKDDPVN